MFLSDRLAMEAIGNSRNMMVPWYLMTAYAYYVLDAPILSDATFDEICIMLDREWDDIEHVHKTWIDRGDLSAGTRLSTLYPSMTRGAASALAGVPYRPSWGLLEALAGLGAAFDQLTGVLPCLKP